MESLISPAIAPIRLVTTALAAFTMHGGVATSAESKIATLIDRALYGSFHSQAALRRSSGAREFTASTRVSQQRERPPGAFARVPAERLAFERIVVGTYRVIEYMARIGLPLLAFFTVSAFPIKSTVVVLFLFPSGLNWAIKAFEVMNVLGSFFKASEVKFAPKIFQSHYMRETVHSTSPYTLYKPKKHALVMLINAMGIVVIAHLVKPHIFSAATLIPATTSATSLSSGLARYAFALDYLASLPACAFLAFSPPRYVTGNVPGQSLSASEGAPAYFRIDRKVQRILPYMASALSDLAVKIISIIGYTYVLRSGDLQAHCLRLACLQAWVGLRKDRGITEQFYPSLTCVETRPL